MKAKVQRRGVRDAFSGALKHTGRRPFAVNRALLFPAAGVMVILLAILVFFLTRGITTQQGGRVAEGVAYLERLEGKDMETVESAVRAVRKEARAQALASGTLPLWAQFDDYVIFGDSRTVGFSYYGFLDEQRVLAEGGLTIADIPTYMDRIVALNPAYLFLCTGINDVSIGLWTTPEAYVTAYEEQMQTLMQALPDTEIYINSIFPAQDPAFAQASAWRNIPEYNVAVQAWCEEKGYHYIDNTQVFEEHKELYDPDGIHFQKAFYEYWAMNMLTEVEI